LIGVEEELATSPGKMIPLFLLLLPAQVLGLAMVIQRFEKRPGRFLTIAVGDIVTGGVFTIVAVVPLELGIQGVLWAQLASKVIWCVYGFSGSVALLTPLWSSGYARAILLFGVPLIPAVMANWGQTYANRFILAVQLPMAEVGIFGLAARIAMIMALVNTAFHNAWLPHVIENAKEPAGKRETARLFDLYLCGAIVIGLFLAAAAPLLVLAIAPAAYFRAGDLIGFMVMGLVWGGAQSILGAGLIIARKSYWNAPVFMIGAGVNLGLLWLAAPKWGVFAAATTYLLGAVTTAILFYLVTQRIEYVPFRVRSLVTGLLLTVVSPLLLLLMRIEQPSVISLAALVPARLMVAITLSLIAVGVILRPEERHRVRVVLYKWRRTVASRSAARRLSNDEADRIDRRR
jgi:O-antigen/teichoic acid export membrane protein